MPSHDLCGAAKNKLFGPKGGAEYLVGGGGRGGIIMSEYFGKMEKIKRYAFEIGDPLGRDFYIRLTALLGMQCRMTF